MKLQRVWKDDVALGAMCDDDGSVFWTTFEDKPIPAGTYTCRWLPHPKHGLCWEVCDVPGRTGILFHVGNDEADSDGCILVGLGFSERAISASIPGYLRFLRFLRKLSTFTLTVSDPA